MIQAEYKFGEVGYIDKPTHLVMYAPHLHRLPKPKIPEFIQKLSTLEALKMESTPILPPDTPKDLIEFIAKLNMIGKPVEYISANKPDGTQLGYAILDYGVPIELTELFISSGLLRFKHSGDINFHENIEEIIKDILIEEQSLRFPNIDIQRSIANYSRLMQSISSGGIMINEETLVQLLEWYGLYQGQIMEYEIMLPDILGFRNRYKGKIGVLAGAFHAENIDRMLDGVLREKPIRWEEYKKTLPFPMRRVLETTEKLIL